MNTIRHEFLRSAVACSAVVAMAFAGAPESTAKDVDGQGKTRDADTVATAPHRMAERVSELTGVKIKVLIPASRPRNGKQDHDGSGFDLKPVSAFLPKGQKVSIGQSFYLAAVRANSDEDGAQHTGSEWHYTALPNYQAVRAPVDVEFDLKPVLALIPKQRHAFVGKKFQVEERSTAVTNDGKFALMGVPVDVQTLQAMVAEQRPAWRSDEDLGAWYKSAEAKSQESLWETLLAPRTF